MAQPEPPAATSTIALAAKPPALQLKTTFPGVLTRLAATTTFRVVAWTVALFVIAAGIIVFVLFQQTNAVLSEQVLASLKGDARAIIAEGRAGGIPAVIETVSARSRSPGPALYLLTDGEGRRLAGNLEKAPPELDDLPRGGVFRYVPIQGQAERLAVALRVDVAGGVRLLIGRDVDDQRAYASRMRTAFLVGFGLISLAGLSAAFFISRTVLRRIEAINDTSRSIMAGDLSRRVPLTGTGDELDALASNLNAMLDRIDELMRAMREVSDNIAHDLKTPLNRLRNRAEAALRDDRGGEGYREGLVQTIERADDLIKTFNALLLIAKLEAGAIESNKTEVDLGALVRDVAELYEPVAEEQGLTLAIEASDGPRIRANRELISQAVANLVDNAIKYSGAGSGEASSGPHILVRVSTGATGAEVSVADRGPGIPSDDRERVLKRFVRLEKSRTQPGTGLGLSLVAAVARLHNGSIRLEDNQPGLRVVFALPQRLTNS